MANTTIQEEYDYTRLTASGQIKASQGMLGGLFCASASGATATIYDSTTGSGTLIVNTFPLTAGTPYPFPCRFRTGCYIVLTGTADITVFSE